MIALIVSMFTLGLVTSLHCASMCGPMVLSCSIKDENSGPWYRAVLPQFAYQSAKILSYVTFGLLLGAVGSVFNLDGVRPWATLVAGAYMIILGLGLTGKVKWAQKFTPRTPRFLMGWIRAIRQRGKSAAGAQETSYDRYVAPTLLGLITGLMPCGALISAYVLAGASGSPIGGAVGMLAFGLGTAPLMMLIGTATGLMSLKIRERVMALLAVVVIVFGVVYLNRAAMLLGSPFTFNTVKTAVLGGPAPAPTQTADAGKTAADGGVEVPLTIQNVQFVPQTVQIPADKPVRLIVDRQEDNACSAQLAIPQLGILQELTPNGTTAVDIPATKAGSYSLTCGMGMMSGSLSVGGAAGSTGGGGVPAWAWLVLALGASGGAIWLSRDIGTPKRTSSPSKNSRQGRPNSPARDGGGRSGSHSKSGSHPKDDAHSKGGHSKSGSHQKSGSGHKSGSHQQGGSQAKHKSSGARKRPHGRPAHQSAS